MTQHAIQFNRNQIAKLPQAWFGIHLTNALILNLIEICSVGSEWKAVRYEFNQMLLRRTDFEIEAALIDEVTNELIERRVEGFCN